MSWQATVDFVDLQDGRRLYRAGETYPRDGLSPSAERIAELAGRDNRMGYPLIREVLTEPAEKPVNPVEEPKRKRAPRKRVKKDD